MAKLLYENGKVIDDLTSISEVMGKLKININSWPLPNEETKQLLSQKSLDEDEKVRALDGLDIYFEKLKTELGYKSRDLIVLHDELEGLEALAAKFDQCHTHDDDEVRYIVDGEGVFGFVLPDGEQVELLVEAGEYINVPKDTEHWFYLTKKNRIKAVRYFTDASGWTPVYTHTAQKIQRVW